MQSILYLPAHASHYDSTMVESKRTALNGHAAHYYGFIQSESALRLPAAGFTVWIGPPSGYVYSLRGIRFAGVAFYEEGVRERVLPGRYEIS